MNSNLITGIFILATFSSLSVYSQEQEEPVLFELNGKPLQGKVVRYNDHNIIEEEALYVDGYKTGKYKSFYRNGILFSEVNYVEGKREGELRIYFENGKLKASYSYSNGLLDGNIISYYSNGVKEFEKNYREGVIQAQINFHNTGEKNEYFLFNSGMLSVWEVYDKKGRIAEKTYFRNNEPQSVEYYKKGKYDYTIHF
ncbi:MULTISPECIES: toxin-antitoxin system YwqK family antitoxin [Myroides]|uniref:Toxin-antitoxin system YwqK family antitoxin n=1 Tax=Myroides albus TaxID=2562892 RepID=A0A6I3LAV0_9FLAO|nr:MULTISPECIES: hypothetical protein [Myroides]MTG96549.1 hypothetical protein [Myroides albus]MVX34545.1 hypothetical protein [Myroides sp. LoEW2-1]UVD81037.1 hypothetical protein NWE55_07255 [Myroides albus]